MREKGENYENTMKLEKGEKFGKLGEDRHVRDLKHITDLRNKISDTLNTTKTERTKVETEYQAMGELQKLIKEAQNYRDEIEDMHVKLQHLSIQIQCLEDTTNTLSE